MTEKSAGQRVALITNVYEYAGPGSVSALTAAGLKVICHDCRFTDERQRVEFEKQNPGAIARAEQTPEELVEAALRDCGRIDALVSNDVIQTPMKRIEDCGVDEFRDVLEIGLVWPFTLVRAVIPQMRQRKEGAIVFITSGAAVRPMHRMAMYGAARAGATALASALSKELGPDNIQVNAIGPNWFKSDTYFSDARLAENPKIMAKVMSEVPIRRLGRQDEMGALVALLVSRAAMPVTGQFMVFGGGYV